MLSGTADHSALTEPGWQWENASEPFCDNITEHAYENLVSASLPRILTCSMSRALPAGTGP